MQNTTPGESSATLRRRVVAARERQAKRFADTKTRQTPRNARMTHTEIRAHCAIDKAQAELLTQAMEQLSLSARAYDRILKVARTIADLAGTENTKLRICSKQFNIAASTGRCFIEQYMKLAKQQETQSTIRFSAKLLRPKATEKAGSGSLLTLPKNASAKLPSRGRTMVEGTINGFPFRAALEPNGEGSHRLKVNQALHDAADADAGDTVTVEITRVGEEPELRMPLDLRQALAAAPWALAMWAKTTPMARRDWILWLSSGKLEETRQIRIKKACSMLATGKRRVCCFGGLSWLRKDHASAGGTWRPLPNAKNRFSPGTTK